MCLHCPGSVLCCSLLLTLFDLTPHYFRSDVAGGEAVGHLFCSVLRDLVVLDEDNGVGAGVARTWHSLGRLSNLISILVLPISCCGLVCNEMVVLQQFSVYTQHKVCHFA